MPENATSVARPGRWGNPYRVGYPDPERRGELMTAERCVELHRGLIERALMGGSMSDIDELRGRDLACWCPIHRNGEYVPCHADVLLSLANGISLEDVVSENLRWAKRKAVQRG